MHITTTRSRPVSAVAITFGLLVPGACMTVAADDEIGTAQRLVAERSDIEVDWRGPWDPGAVEWPPPRPLDAREAARLALRNHAGIRAGVAGIVEARADHVQAHLLPNPVINASLGFAVDGGGGEPAMGTLLQPLAALWQRPAAIDATAARLRAAVLAVSDAAVSLVAAAELAHARLVFAGRDLGLENAVHALAAEELELVEQRLAEGEATRLDRNRMALEVLDAAQRVTDATTRRDRARRTLLEVCGVADRLELPPAERVPAPVPAWVAQLTEGEVIRMAEAQRLDLAAARALMEGAIDEVRLAELQRIPDVSVGAAYQRNFEGREAVGPSLRLEIPIFDTGRAAAAKAEALADAARAEAERQRQAAIAEVRGVWVELRGALANVERLRASVLALAIENRELAERSLDAGVIDAGTALELRRRELRARLAVSAAERAAREWHVELVRAVGGRLSPPEPSEPSVENDR